MLPSPPKHICLPRSCSGESLPLCQAWSPPRTRRLTVSFSPARHSYIWLLAFTFHELYLPLSSALTPTWCGILHFVALPQSQAVLTISEYQVQIIGPIPSTRKPAKFVIEWLNAIWMTFLINCEGQRKPWALFALQHRDLIVMNTFLETSSF